MSNLKSAILNNRFTHLIPDKVYLSIIYFLKYRRLISWKNPCYFTEKLQWIKLNVHDKRYSDLVDKIKVKDYIKKVAPDLKYAKTIKVFSDDSIDFSDVNLPYVVKCNHDSGSSLICKNKEPSSDAISKLKDNLTKNFYWSWREWPYKNIEKHIFIEEYLSCSDNHAYDIKVYCFNGEPAFFYVYGTEENKKTLDVFDVNWNHTDIRHRNINNSKSIIEKPRDLCLLFKYSRCLSTNLQFARIDFVICDDDIYFSEITLFPSGGFFPFEDKQHDLLLGTKLKLNV